MTEDEKKDLLKKHLEGIGASSFHIEKGHNTVEGVKKAYQKPMEADGVTTFPLHDDTAAIQECINALVTEGVLQIESDGSFTRVAT